MIKSQLHRKKENNLILSKGKVQLSVRCVKRGDVPDERGGRGVRPQMGGGPPRKGSSPLVGDY